MAIIGPGDHRVLVNAFAVSLVVEHLLCIAQDHRYRSTVDRFKFLYGETLDLHKGLKNLHNFKHFHKLFFLNNIFIYYVFAYVYVFFVKIFTVYYCCI